MIVCHDESVKPGIFQGIQPFIRCVEIWFALKKIHVLGKRKALAYQCFQVPDYDVRLIENLFNIPKGRFKIIACAVKSL